jgi:hypothetical protein
MTAPKLPDGLEPGRRVRAKQAIYESADDCHPGGYLCQKGDLLIVRAVRSPGSFWRYSVSHETVTDRSFSVDEAEIELDAAIDSAIALAAKEAK